ncbi:hypothetical protein CEXT_388931 [Caerostris extrusa]|uniref:Maturase K n=1 Tax=Caerostris extrusa TaxID=172846 RepID=A0AAV4MKD2_CAEEX|nr:hypothetical protein CEXT_388931 [Caerostris extrusa]
MNELLYRYVPSRLWRLYWRLISHCMEHLEQNFFDQNTSPHYSQQSKCWDTSFRDHFFFFDRNLANHRAATVDSKFVSYRLTSNVLFLDNSTTTSTSKYE